MRRHERDWTGTQIGDVVARAGERPRCTQLGVLYKLEFAMDLVGAHGAVQDAAASAALQGAWGVPFGYGLQEVVTRARAFLQRQLLKRCKAGRLPRQTLICPVGCGCQLHR